jgi:hypothetical protein
MAVLSAIAVFIVFMCTVGDFVALWAGAYDQGLVFMSVRNIHLGTTTLEMRRPDRERFVCVPDQGIRVHRLLPGERLYDLTPSQNWRRFMARPFMGDGNESSRLMISMFELFLHC